MNFNTNIIITSKTFTIMREVTRQTGLDGNVYRIVDYGVLTLDIHIYTIERLKIYDDVQMWIREDDMYHKGVITDLDVAFALFNEIITKI